MKMDSNVHICGRSLALLYGRTKLQLQYYRLCWVALTYNTYGSITESIFEPIFYLVDFAARWFGAVFVALVICLTTSVVVIYYQVVIPHLFATRMPFSNFLTLSYGHYLLLMIIFHYMKGVTTNPGNPPKDMKGIPTTSVCKRCLLPKPPRAHHCSVCKYCRLKMDHHCPWLNNCVGHFNHRYFISFCIFMCLGTIFVSLSSWDLFNDCFRFHDKTKAFKASIYTWITGNTPSKDSNDGKQTTSESCREMGQFYSSSVIYLWILCSAVTLALGGLTGWHVYQISIGETSIERLINSKERRRLKRLDLDFVNVYDYGVFNNWKLLLGFHDFRSFAIRVLLPSSHPPYCDGIRWTCRITETSDVKTFIA